MVDDERDQLSRWIRSRKSSRPWRCVRGSMWTVLWGSLTGTSLLWLAAQPLAETKWCSRFVERRLGGLSVDAPPRLPARSASSPVMPGIPLKRASDSVWHGTLSLFAVMNDVDGAVFGSTFRWLPGAWNSRSSWARSASRSGRNGTYIASATTTGRTRAQPSCPWRPRHPVVHDAFHVHLPVVAHIRSSGCPPR